MKQYINEVSGLVGLPERKKYGGPRVGIKGLRGPQDITPKEIRARYNVSENLIATNKDNLHACSEFQEQYYSPSDLSTFFKKYVSEPNVKSTVDQVIVFNNPKQPQLEGSLDIQYLMGVP